MTRCRALHLRVLVALMLTMGSLAVMAQDPRASAAQTAARSFLVLIDQGDAAGAWAVSGRKFQEALPLSRWVSALAGSRSPLGRTEERALTGVQFSRQFPGFPDGDYALLTFRTTFAKRMQGAESVSLEREADGQWRVIGYFVK